MLSLMELMDYDPKEFEELKEKKKIKPKKTLLEKRLIAKRILLGSTLAFTIGFTTGMISSTINQNKIDRLSKEQDKMYEQYMQSDEFQAYSRIELNNLADKYYSGEIDYDTFKSELDKVYSIETAEKLLEGSTHELKDDIKQIEHKITETNQKYNKSAVNIGSIGLLGAGILTALSSAIVYTYYDLETVGKSKIAYQEYETGPILIDKKQKRTKNKTSCNENCLGIRYYDSNTMTIRNTNGKDEENEQNLNQ